MRVAVIDDDQGFSEKLQDMVGAFFKKKDEEIQMVLFINGLSLLNELEESRNYDIYFLDVEMPGLFSDRLDGIELAGRIRGRDKGACIVFITNYEKYALPSYKVRAYDFILKKEWQQRLPLLLEQIWEEKLDARRRQKREQYVIRNDNESHAFQLDDVMYLTKDKKYTCFHCVKKEEYRERNTLDVISQRLPADRFIFIDRSCIINMKYVVAQAGVYITLQDENDEVKLQMSRRMSAEIKGKLARYWGMT